MDANAIKEGVQAVVDGLTPLAQKLQIPLEGLFRWGVRHNYAMVVRDLVPVLLAGLGIWKLAKLLKWGFSVVPNPDDQSHYRSKKNNFDMNEAATWYTGFLTVAVILCVIWSMIVGPTAVERLFAPEWCTLKDLHELITGK